MNLVEMPASAETRRQAGIRSKAMRSALAGAIVAASTTWLCVPTAWAGRAELETTLDVSPKDDVIPPANQTYSVSVSKTGLSSNVSYHVTVANNGNNTINHIVFKASATVSGQASGIAGYSAFVNVGAADPNCAQPTLPAVSTVTCAIGQLKRGDSRDFFLIFRAPEAGATIEFAGVTDFGGGTSSNVPPADVNRLVANSMVLLASGGNAAKTVFPPTGGTYFTGDDGNAGPSNLFATKVFVPPTIATKTVTDDGIKQVNALSNYPCSSANPGYFCYGLSSKIDIRDAKTGTKVHFDQVAPGQKVQITLRQDATSIKAKLTYGHWPAINDVKIFYNASGVVDGLGAPVPACYGNLPQPGQPCVSSRTVVTIGAVQPADRDADDIGWMGYYEYVIQAVDNGVYSW